jgi:TonB-dependent SusC/RagA subfamily outer membrane receptor
MITRNLLTRSYKLLLTLLVLLMSTNAFAQRLTATGKVVDTAGLEVIGASVLEKGTTNGVVTNLDGEFSLSVEQNATLVISFIGYKTMEVKATTNMNVTLQEDNELLDEVVVIGYGSVKRKDVTTAVSTVSTKDLDQRPIVSAAQALQGKAAGVSVMQPSGEPGGGMSIRVRGTTSFNGSNDPLYVVDGVPVDNINFLSPNDIESLSILKDASSAAIYGSRAANGVVLITTKAGAEGNAKVALNVQYGMTKVAKSMEALNTEQYRELQKEIGAVNPADLEGLTDQTDWFDEVYKTGQTQNYQVSVSNGNEKMKYFLSAGYLDEKGILEGTYFKRYSFRANIDNQIRSWLNVSANISYSDNIGNTGIISGTGANRGGVVLSVINTPTYAPIWDPEKPNQYNKNFYGVNIMNPMENLARQKNNKNKENRLIASGAATISFLPNLKLKSSVALDRRNGEKQLEFPACPKGARLDILVEAMGRINFGRAIKDFKGITQSVELTVDIDGRPFTCNLKDWEVYNLEDTYDFYKNMKFQPIGSLKDELGQHIPGCYRATFKVNKPSDTFLNFETWGKGLVYVNGHAMGRIWEIGPQQTLYIPGCWLKKGENEVIVFDIIGPKEVKSEGLSEPLLDQLLVTKPLTHRNEGENLDLSGEQPVLSGSFNPGNGWQERKFDQPVTGRYVCLEALSAQDGKDLACIAEMYLLDENGERLSREPWIVNYADSEDVSHVNCSADKIFDLQESTYWSTTKDTPYPHSVVIDLGSTRTLTGIQYLPRMESEVPGGIKDFKVYVKSKAFNY